MREKTKYEKLSDLQKLKKQWTKLSGLHNREEWSAAIVRAATASEIAANYAIRHEFALKSEFSEGFVDNLLIWANGLNGKMSKLLVPLAEGAEKQAKMKALKTLADAIAQKRNAVAHQGEFCNEGEATLSIDQAYQFITGLVGLYYPSFTLKRSGEKK